MAITRVTQNLIFNTTRDILQQQQRRLLTAQEIVATQKRINRLSDDPVGAGQVFDLRTQLAQTSQFLRNIDRGTSLANSYDTTLGQASDLLVRARELVLSQANTATTSAQTREAVAIELIALREQLLDLANTRVGNQYIYSGHRTDVRAFEGVTVAATPGGGNTGTGAVSQAGVSNITNVDGDAYRIVFTGPATYDIVNVTDSATVSSGNTYTPGEDINFAGLTVRIEGAPAAGDTFDITTTAAGAYNGDSGLIRLEIEQGVLANANLTGDVVFQGAGLTGGVDLFQMFNDAITALRTNDEAGIVGTLDTLDQAERQIVGQRAVIGARENLFDNTTDRLLDLEVNLKSLISSIEDVDVAEAITNFTVAENAYQASLGAASRMIQPSLLDFLR
jgi:flagellar hook-associated protein 3 FlgL